MRHLLDLMAVVECGDNLSEMAPNFLLRHRNVLLDTLVDSVFQTATIEVLSHQVNPVAIRVVNYLLQWHYVSMDHFLEDGELIAF